MSDTPHAPTPLTTNRLNREKSPYLLQHAHNPVDWYPWGDEAFSVARREDKLIFLSIGYSTCHWCHVMAHESFADPEVAKALQRWYIAVKVDREERPDIDQIYMAFCQRLTGRGGWPLTLVLTADGMPVFAATYLPKDPRPGYDGLIALLERIAAQARKGAAELRHAGKQLVESMQAPPAANTTPEPFEQLQAAAASELLRSFDPREGGFGNAPKFPTPHHLRFLIRRWHHAKRPELLQMAEQTLASMRRGGIFDHLGGGFHRYATDSRWLLPHFEKMLYDQAGLADAYLDAWLATEKFDYADTTQATLDYTCRELLDPCGAFHAAEDADSEGEEGLFYLWDKQEIGKILAPDSAELFCAVYGVEPGGNYRDETSRIETGRNILHLSASFEQQAERFDLGVPQIHARLEKAREHLFRVRQLRPHPARDDKILCAWNVMIIGALARAGRFLNRPDYTAAAEDATAFILKEMRRKDGRLLRRWRDNEAAIPAFAEDYAFLIRGLLELYAAHFKLNNLQIALQLAEDLFRLFSPQEGGALYDSGHDAAPLVTRPRTLHDGAHESANSVALEVFSRLHLLTGDPVWRDRAESLFHHLAPLVKTMPGAFTGMLLAAALLHGKTREIVIVGAPEKADTKALLNVATSAKDPTLSVLLTPPGTQELAQIAPFTEHMVCIGDAATVYLCSGQRCQQPCTDPEELRRQLQSC